MTTKYLTKEFERRLAVELPQHFYMEGDKLFVRFDELWLRKDPDHKGQLLMDIRHLDETLVTQMLPDQLEYGKIVIHGLTGSTGISFIKE